MPRTARIPAGIQSLITDAGLMQYRYDEHDVSMICPGGPLDLEVLDYGAIFTFTNFKHAHGRATKRREGKLTITVTKRAVAPDRTLTIDFELRLSSGGGAMVFLRTGPNYCIIQGHIFCGRSAGHVVFEELIRPLLEGDATAMKKEVKEVQTATGDLADELMVKVEEREAAEDTTVTESE